MAMKPPRLSFVCASCRQSISRTNPRFLSTTDTQRRDFTSQTATALDPQTVTAPESQNSNTQLQNTRLHNSERQNEEVKNGDRQMRSQRKLSHRPLAASTAPDPAGKKRHPIPSALFIASLGNPGAEYAATRHSAGHILLDAMRLHVNANADASRTSTHVELPISLREVSVPNNSQSSSSQHNNGQFGASQSGNRQASSKRPQRTELSFDAELQKQDSIKTQLREAAIAARDAPTRPVCFFRSPSYMNVSGPGLVREFSAFSSMACMDEGDESTSIRSGNILRLPGNNTIRIPNNTRTPQGNDLNRELREYLAQQSARPEVRFAFSLAQPALIVLHDELESPLGTVTLKNASGLSARGHNGLKSIETQRKELGNAQYVRVGIGIGPRPQSRDPEDVARFVLQRMSDGQIDVIRRLAGPVWEKLNQIMGAIIPGKPIHVGLHTR